jgi:hypothetical protein
MMLAGGVYRKGESDYVEGGGGIRIRVPGSSVRYDVTPKDDGRERRALKDDGERAG